MNSKRTVSFSLPNNQGLRLQEQQSHRFARPEQWATTATYFTTAIHIVQPISTAGTARSYAGACASFLTRFSDNTLIGMSP
jgi:hypothetical protein